MNVAKQLRYANRCLFSCCEQHAESVEALQEFHKREQDLVTKKNNQQKRMDWQLTMLIAEIEAPKAVEAAEPQVDNLGTIVDKIKQCRKKIAEHEEELVNMRERREVLKDKLFKLENAMKKTLAEINLLQERL